MRPVWKVGSPICTAEFTAALIERSHREGRSQHQALDALYVAIMRKKVNWMLDCDIRGFFDNLSHDWLLKFVQHRVADLRILRLIQKWLKAGVMEEGEWKDTEMGTPQGSVISPLLANIYLHYVFDLWVDVWPGSARGAMSLSSGTPTIMFSVSSIWLMRTAS
jgi:retron-type reverse transcriptase